MNKNLFFFIILIVATSCSNLTPNQDLVDSTHSNLKHFKSLVEKLKSDKVLFEKLIKIRNNKSRTQRDPMNVDSEYRLVLSNELNDLNNPNWLTGEAQFAGFRIIDKNLIIIEIGRFDRHTLTEQYGRSTWEFHRLIFSNRNPEWNKFFYRTEKEIWKEKIEPNLIYQVTQLKR